MRQSKAISALLPFFRNACVCTFWLASLPALADTLVLDNGDRITGTLIGVEGDVYPFDSPRLGRLIVPVQSAQVEGAASACRRNQTVNATSLGGRFSTSTEIVHNSKSERLIKVNFRLEKRWREDEFVLHQNMNLSRAMEPPRPMC